MTISDRAMILDALNVAYSGHVISTYGVDPPEKVAKRFRQLAKEMG